MGQGVGLAAPRPSLLTEHFPGEYGSGRIRLLIIKGRMRPDCARVLSTELPLAPLSSGGHWQRVSPKLRPVQQAIWG